MSLQPLTRWTTDVPTEPNVVHTASPTRPPAERPLEDLLDDIATASPNAFAALYDRMAPAVYGIARRVLRNDAMAEEAAHDALLDVWVSCKAFDRSRGSARSWILAIAHRRAVDAVRTEQAARDREGRLSAKSWDRAHDTVSEAALQNVADAQVKSAVEKLSELQRRALELAYFGGFTHREVAGILDVPLGTAKSRITEGLRRMRKELAEQDQ